MLGGTKELKKDVRIIATSNKCLFEEMKEGRFRKDLYYRIKILDLHIPPLRERKEDIPLLVEYILENENNKNKKNKKFSHKALNKLFHYDYPGNVRELENIIKRAYALTYEDELKEKDIELETQASEKKISISQELYTKVVNDGKSFYEVVHKPFLKRELNRKEIKEIIALGLSQTKGSYKKLLDLFNIGEGEKEYKKFMKILATHKLGIIKNHVKHFISTNNLP